MNMERTCKLYTGSSCFWSFSKFFEKIGTEVHNTVIPRGSESRKRIKDDENK